MFKSKELSHFHVLERLGSGAQGGVFKVKNKKDKQIYALKVYNSLEHDTTAKNFLSRELEVLKKLHHPNIIKIYDGNIDIQEPYLLMEYVSHNNLTQYLAKNNVPLQEKLLLIYDITQAVNQLHCNNVIHRDIKPDNILISDTQPPYALLGDFGLAKAHYHTSLTATRGSPIGTPQFMPPEVFLQGNPIDKSFDIYSLGMTMFITLCGTVPYDTTSTVTFLEFMKSPQTPQLQDYLPSVPQDLNQLCLQLMHKDSAQRYNSIEKALEDFTELTLMKNNNYLNQHKYRAFHHAHNPSSSSSPSNNLSDYLSFLKSQIDNVTNKIKQSLWKPHVLVPGDTEISFENPQLLQQALKGDKASILEIAHMYQYGTKKVPVNYWHAESWYFHASKKGHSATAFYQLGLLYEAHGSQFNRDTTITLEYFEKAAHLNHVEAMYKTGLYYKKLESKQETALLWFVKAAAQQHTKALDEVDACYSSGLGIINDYKKHQLTHNQAPEPCDHMHYIGYLHGIGHGVDTNYDIASFWFTKALEANNSKSYYTMGNLLATNKLPHLDSRKAKEYYVKSAQLGNVNALVILGKLYLHHSDQHNVHGFTQNIPQAISFYKQAAQKQHIPSLHLLGDIYEHGSEKYESPKKPSIHINLDRAKHYYTLAAELGDIKALTKVSLIQKSITEKQTSDTSLQTQEDNPEYAVVKEAKQYLHGIHFKNLHGVQIKNATRAINLYEEAIKEGNSYAMTELGHLYFDGKYVTQDKFKAHRLYKQAAERNNSDAMVMLGLLATSIDHPYMPEGFDYAKEMLEKAVELDHPDAYFHLSYLYENKRNDHETSKKYLRLAQKKGHKDYYRYLARFYIHGGISTKKNKTYIDFDKAKKAYEQGIMEGDHEALVDLGKLYRKKDWKHHSYAHAKTLCETAILHNNTNAMLELGHMYEHGHGVKKSLTDADTWYTKAFELGNKKAENAMQKNKAVMKSMKQLDDALQEMKQFDHIRNPQHDTFEEYDNDSDLMW